MKTKDLIAALNEVDPTGEMEVCVGNQDIHFVAVEPAYHDGCLQVLLRDEKVTDCYNVIGAEIRSDGAKLNIETLSIKSALWNDPEMPVGFVGDYAKEHYAKSIATERKAVRDHVKKERRVR